MFDKDFLEHLKQQQEAWNISHQGSFEKEIKNLLSKASTKKVTVSHPE